MRIRSVLKHSTQAVLEGALIASLVVGLMAGTAFAGKPGGGGGGKPPRGGASGSIALALVSDANTNGSPNWNDTITFTVTGGGTNPFVSVTCAQGGTMVYSASAGFYDSYPWPGARNMPLYSPRGPAERRIVARPNGRAALSFSVGA